MISREELEEVITTCWLAASHAPLPGFDQPMVMDQNNKQLNSVRYETYKTLLANLIPNQVCGTNKTEITNREPKKPWERDDDEDDP